jgi:hypothetical protein
MTNFRIGTHTRQSKVRQSHSQAFHTIQTRLFIFKKSDFSRKSSLTVTQAHSQAIRLFTQVTQSNSPTFNTHKSHNHAAILFTQAAPRSQTFHTSHITQSDFSRKSESRNFHTRQPVKQVRSLAQSDLSHN